MHAPNNARLRYFVRHDIYVHVHLIHSFCSHGPTHFRLTISSDRPKGCMKRWSASERSEVLVAMVIIVSAYWAYSIVCQILFSFS